MANNGISTFLAAPIVTETPLLYGPVTRITGAVQAESSITYNDAAIYSDNRLKHKDATFASGTITLTGDYADQDIFSPLLGRQVKEEMFTPPGGSPIPVRRHISNTGDIPVPQGFGYIVTDLDVDAKSNVFRVRFFYHVEFSQKTEPEQTKEATKTYQRPTVVGTIYELENGDWCEEVDFAELTNAAAYLYHLMGSTAGGGVDLSALSIGSLTLTPEFAPSATVYISSTTNSSDTVTATPANPGAVAEVRVNGAVVSGGTATWTAGLNEIKVTVTEAAASKVYTVIVTKE